MKIRLLPEAERDLEIGADFYESQQSGLGTYFNDCLASEIESLRIYAGIHEVYRGFHRSLSKRFPFSIYYILNEDCVDIYAVLDARLDPETIDTILNSQRTKR
ncbi:MAG: type II toxin-antitoxin system RelE/ParE family toxin [Pirellulaceae bacterium]